MSSKDYLENIKKGDYFTVLKGNSKVNGIYLANKITKDSIIGTRDGKVKTFYRNKVTTFHKHDMRDNFKRAMTVML